MVGESEAQSGQSSLRPRARLLRTIGDQLISSPAVAVIELVKNAYDADARRVILRISPEEDLIELIDDGGGMSLSTVRTAWMEPATDSRVRSIRSQKYGRRVLGAKGIGRFASSRLADRLDVVTKQIDSEEIYVRFDWTAFDSEAKYLDEIQVTWQTRPPEVFVQGGRAERMGGESPESLHGTLLVLSGLRDSWSRSQVEELRRQLTRLVSPFAEEIADSFQITLDLPAALSDLAGPIGLPPLLSRPHYRAIGHVDRDGNYELLVESSHSQSRIVTGTAKEIASHNVGPFDVEWRIWDRDSDSLRGVMAPGDTLRSVRRTLDQFAGVNIYRDGFRVLPYGEAGDDWLHLDLRRVNNPTLRISNNQVLGYVSITADGNPQLADQTNREGLQSNAAFDAFRFAVTELLSRTEIVRDEFRRRPTAPAAPSSSTSVLSGLSLSGLAEVITTGYANEEPLQRALRAQTAALDESVREVREVLGRFQRLATLGFLVDTVLHDGRTYVGKIANESMLGLRDLRRAVELETLRGVLSGRLTLVDEQAKLLSILFRKIEPFGGRRRGRPIDTDLNRVIRDAFSLMQSDLEQEDVRCSLPQGQLLTTVDEAEIEMVLVNLLTNSLYWLRKGEVEDKAIAVESSRDETGVRVIFADNGPGVPEEVRDRIFEPYFTTKPDGVGLGLAIAGEIVSEYYGGTLELLSSGPLPGATFAFTLKRRV